MSNLTIACPHCSKPFELTEALAAPLLEAERGKIDVEVGRRLAAELDAATKKASAAAAAEYVIKLQASEAALAERDIKLRQAQESELKIRAERVQLEQAKQELDLTVQRRVDAEKKAASEQAVASAAAEFAIKLKATEAELAQRDAKLREAQGAELKMRAERVQLEQARQEIDLTVQRRVDAEKKAAADQASAAVAAQYDVRLKATEAALAEKDAKVKAAEESELRALKLKQEAEEASRTTELTVARRMEEEGKKLREEALRQRDEEIRLKMAEKDKQMSDMREQIEDLRRKGDSASQQLVGEVLEVDLMDVLKAAFPGDEFQRVKKGQSGADLLHIVRGRSGMACGKILWETKRTKNWADGWLTKLREDQRAAKADIAALMSETLPDGMRHFDAIEGVWVTGIAIVVPMAAALRQGLLDTASARRAAEGADTKKDLVYAYLTGNEFLQRVRGAVEPVIEMRADLEREKRLLNKHWGARDKQIDRAMQNLVAMHGDLQGIIGNSLPAVEGLTFDDLPEPAATLQLQVDTAQAGMAPELQAEH